MSESKKTLTTRSTAIHMGGGANIAYQLLGEMPADAKIINSYEDYEKIYHKRHDIIHSAVCDKLGVDFGETRVDEVMKSHGIDISQNIHYESIRGQTPDYVGISGKIVTIYEVTISNDSRAKSRKAAKYALLCKVLKDEGFTIIYKIFVFIPHNIFLNREELIMMGLDDTVIDFANEVCKNTMNLLRLVHKTTDGQNWHDTFFEIIDSSSEIKFSRDEVITTHETLENKCFHSTDDLKEILFSKTSTTITDDEGKFLSEILSIGKTLINPITEKERFSEFDFIDKINARANTDKYRSSMPMCFIKVKMIDSAIRNTTNDWDKLSEISGKMEGCDDSVINTLGHYCNLNLQAIRNKEITNDDYLFVCNFSEVENYKNALEGPGRKKYIKRASAEHIKEDDSHSGYALRYNVDVSDIDYISQLLSEKNKVLETGDIFKDSKSLSNLSGIGLDYVKLCQTIFREINVNAMRGDRRHKMIIKPTGADGVYICLYKGSKLRCGELANLVWYKVIIDNDVMNTDLPFSNHWIFKKFHRDRMVSYTDWLSCDVHRLDHYIRCYDKLLMAYLSVVSQRFKSTCGDEAFSLNRFDEHTSDAPTLIKLVNADDTNTLGLMILIYLEDKRSTSKMMQNVRYVVMTSISIYPKYNSVMEKFLEPIRTPLQLYLLKKIVDYIIKMRNWNPNNSVRFGNVKYDYKSHTFLDMMGGSNIRLPRPIISSPSGVAEFSEILSEMYFTMLFNKNQDDPTHASFQILNKIIEGETNFKSVKADGDHLGYRQDCDDIEFAKKVLTLGRTHMFSRRAIEIGSKLLRISLDDEFGDQIKRAATKQNVNKHLDEFATFKSSSKPGNLIFNPTNKRQNPRQKCIEGVMSLLDDGLTHSFDVVDKVKNEKTTFDVFKKNQIGGVREILILPITVRIKINILETVSRNICSFDRREVLTHGAQKNESIKAILYSAKKLEGTRAPIHMTFDKSKWGPSFVPIQFLYLFTPFKKQLGDLFPYIADLLIRHQNKSCMMPDRLMTAWNNDPDNRHKHQDEGLQRQKEVFLSNKKIEMENESNMGQGILHYTSSLLHLCMVAFRDKLYDMWCSELSLNSRDHEDLLSSDDSYTIFCPELSRTHGKSLVSLKMSMFLKCQRISELLFNCRTSMVKSSINPLIGEFNSLFISNMSFIPTLMKFTLSSVHPFNSDSFFRMVKEAYSSSRQIVENGGGMDLYLVSSYLNKSYCEDMYHVNDVNNFEQFDVNLKPYHVGHFPIFNPALMIIFGPEYYNYKLYKKHFRYMNENEKRLFMSSHKIIKGGLIETMAEFEEGDTILGGLMRIEAAVGPIKQLERIRDKAVLNQNDLQTMIAQDPLLIIRKPKTLEEIKFKTVHKLYTTGSKEAVKNIAASIFYGRVSASVSANAYYIPNGSYDKTTYLTCLTKLIKDEGPIINFDDHIRFLYPKHGDYDMFLDVDEIRLKYNMRNPLEIQTVQTLATHRIYTRLTQQVESILDYRWGLRQIPDHLATKVERDFLLMKHHFPLIKDTLEETLNVFSGTREDQTKAVLLLILKLFSLRDRNFKGVLYGMGSNDVSRTYDSLLERNLSAGYTTELIKDYELIRSEETFEKIYCAHNQTILSHFSESKISRSLWDDISDRELMIFFQDTRISKSIKKRVFMCAVTNGFIQNSDEWSSRVGIILHYWHLKQSYIQGKYQGSFDITLYTGKSKLNYYFDSDSNRTTIQKVNLEDPDQLFLFFKELAELLDTSVEDLVKNCEPGNWAIVKDKILHVIDGGFRMDEIDQINPILYTQSTLEVDNDWTRLVDSDGYRIFSVETGLLSSEYEPQIDYDFKVFGLSFVSICKIGAFNQNFKVFYKTREGCLEILDDMIVPKPVILEITRSRLGLKENWGTKDKEEDKEEEIIIEDSTDIISKLMDVEVTSETVLKMLEENKGEDDLDMILSFIAKTDVIYSMKTSQRVQHTRKIYGVVKNLKYDLIVRQLLLDMRVNKQLIKSIQGLFVSDLKVFMMYSLISFYDRLYQNNNQSSPGGLTLDVSQDFLNKFELNKTDDDEIDI